MYSGLPDVCTLVKDPNDQCCMTPVCTLVSGNTLAPIYGNSTAPPTSLEVLPVGTHQVITGYGKPPVGSIYHSRSKCITFQSVYYCKTFFSAGVLLKKNKNVCHKCSYINNTVFIYIDSKITCILKHLFQCYDIFFQTLISVL